MNIEDLLGDYKCPDINGLYYGDGSIAVLDCNTNEGAFVNVINHFNIRDLAVDATGLVDFDYIGERFFGEFIARYGEGSSGGDGVFCLFDKTTKKFLWFLFLDNSNLFCDVEFFENNILLHSTNGAIFSIPVEQPELIKVIRSSDF